MSFFFREVYSNFTITIPQTITINPTLTIPQPNLIGSATNNSLNIGNAPSNTTVTVTAALSDTIGFGTGDLLTLNVNSIPAATVNTVNLYPATGTTTCLSGDHSLFPVNTSFYLTYTYTSTNGSVKQAGNLTGTLTLTATAQ